MVAAFVVLAVIGVVFVGGRKLSKLWESGARNAIAPKIREPLNPQTVCAIFVAAAFAFLGSGPGCVCLQPWALQALGEWPCDAIAWPGPERIGTILISSNQVFWQLSLSWTPPRPCNLAQIQCSGSFPCPGPLLGPADKLQMRVLTAFPVPDPLLGPAS